MDEFEFEWEVLEVRADDEPGQNGALVRYIPDHEGCSIVELFVPVPFHKVRDKEHALDIMEKKINAKAPTGKWRMEITPDESGDTATIGDEVAAEFGVNNERFDADATGGAQRADVPGEGGHQGQRGDADGAAADEAGGDSQPASGAGTEPAGRRRRR